MRRRRVLVALCVLASPRVGFAQRIAPAAVVHRRSPDSLNGGHTAVRSFGIRSLTAALGFAVGVGAGLALAEATGPHGCGGCDDPGLGEAVLGAAVGGAVGAALGATLPPLGTRCSKHARFLRAIAGSVVGSVVGTAIGFNAGSSFASDGGYWVVGWPIGTTLGASTALIGC